MLKFYLVDFRLFSYTWNLKLCSKYFIFYGTPVKISLYIISVPVHNTPCIYCKQSYASESCSLRNKKVLFLFLHQLSNYGKLVYIRIGGTEYYKNLIFDILNTWPWMKRRCWLIWRSRKAAFSGVCVNACKMFTAETGAG